MLSELYKIRLVVSKAALEICTVRSKRFLRTLKNSGAWKQTGDNVFQGDFNGGRSIATGNINIFGGTPDGNSYIRTNNGSSENDLAGGV